jgi:hypothetical protein
VALELVCLLYCAPSAEADIQLLYLLHSIPEISALSNKSSIRNPGIMSSDPHSKCQVMQGYGN